MNKLIVSPSPHDENYVKTTNIMLNVIIALMPALIVGCVYFGWRALVLTAVCVGSCIFFEYASRKMMKRSNTIGDLSAVVTGVLLAMNLPVTLPYWLVCCDRDSQAAFRRNRTEFCQPRNNGANHTYGKFPVSNDALDIA